MTVRAKFKVNRLEVNSWSAKPDGTAERLYTVFLSPVYDPDGKDHENHAFWKATPSGEIKLGTVNEEAAKQFLGFGLFYVDFTPAES